MCPVTTECWRGSDTMTTTFDPHQADIDRISEIKDTILKILGDPANHPIRAGQLESQVLRQHPLASRVDHRVAILALLAGGMIDYLPDESITLIPQKGD